MSPIFGGGGWDHGGMPDNLVRVSKRMAYVLRHAPDTAGLTLDANGWVPVADLLAALRIDRATLDAVVESNDKKRYAIEPGPDGRDRVRASQGHSVDVDLELVPVDPPEFLYHGTPEANVASIRRHGLRKGSRQHVHLSVDVETALAVGRRRHPARVAILSIAAAAMTGSGYVFYRSANGVWLADAVPPAFITETAPVANL
jgi:putative RNA 2'-phosphotransferase